MQPVAYFTLLLVVASSIASAASQPEQVANSVSGQPQGGVVVGNSPSVVGVQQQQSQPQVVVGSQSPVVSEVNSQQPSNVVVETHPHPVHGYQHQQQQQAFANYYAPAGLINVVGEQQQPGLVGNQKPQQVVGARNFEQYGQPESAGLPANYKPFGSWGLYIGGNPADGYYTNYYKALSNSVNDKPQSGAVVSGVEQPIGSSPFKPVVSQTAALSPVLRQASSSPYVGGDYYPFAYAPSDLSVANRGVAGVESVVHGSPVSPVQAGAQVYGSPAAFESNYGISPYADAYATKRVGAAYAQKEMTKDMPAVQQPVAATPASTKGYQSRVYVYPTQASAPVYGQQQPLAQQQNQVVAYPVPVGSQIIGSQAGVDGAFAPYGVHAFTRYAVKPTVMSHQEPSYYYSAQQPSTYKQQSYQHHQQNVYQPTVGASYYPLSYYGYPLNQLHYSQGSPFQGSGVEQQQPAHHVPVVGQPQFEGSVVGDKIESEDKYKQQKKA